MKYIEDIEKAPKKMGSAEIVIAESALPGGIPFREDRQIFLPDDGDARFYLIAKRQQFLCTVNVAPPHGTAQRRLFFGGMDESPFLVELQLSLIEQLIVGEEAFFEALKPEEITRWERNFQIKAKRQGDFFAIAPPDATDWGKFIAKYVPRGLQVSAAEEHVLNGTRHKFNGLIGTVTNSANPNLLIGEGTIKAPDHADLTLDRPHLIIQSLGLVHPQKAD